MQITLDHCKKIITEGNGFQSNWRRERHVYPQGTGALRDRVRTSEFVQTRNNMENLLHSHRFYRLSDLPLRTLRLCCESPDLPLRP